MDNIFLKEILLKNKSGIYSQLVRKFYEPGTTPSFLRSWIAKQLDVDEKFIKKKSLTSAINRYLKKSNTVQSQKGKHSEQHKNLVSSIPHAHHNTDQFLADDTPSNELQNQSGQKDFVFSKPKDDVTSNSGIQES